MRSLKELAQVVWTAGVRIGQVANGVYAFGDECQGDTRLVLKGAAAELQEVSRQLDCLYTDLKAHANRHEELACKPGEER